MKVRDVIDMKGNIISREIISTNEKVDTSALVTFYSEQLREGEIDHENDSNQN